MWISSQWNRYQNKNDRAQNVYARKQCLFAVDRIMLSVLYEECHVNLVSLFSCTNFHVKDTAMNKIYLGLKHQKKACLQLNKA